MTSDSATVLLPRWVRTDPECISRLLLWSAWLLVFPTAAAAFFLPTWEAQQFVLFYLAPTVPAILLWARERVRHQESYTKVALRLDLIVFLLAAVRTLTGALPFSGHMLFLTYVLLSVSSPAYRLLALALWVETAYFKLVLWDDPRSWSIGFLFGIGLGVIYRLRA